MTGDLDALGVEVVPLDRILGSIIYLPLNVGEAWGHLRIFPTDNDELRATDIPIFNELPLDLSVVAGTITKAVQDTNSHVNLKSKERDTPNAVLRDAGPDHPRLAPFADQPVHLVVGRDDFSIEPTTEEIVAEKLAEKLRPAAHRAGLAARDRAPLVRRDGRRHRPRGPWIHARYGGKAANLGFLAHRDVLGTVDDPGSPSAERGYDLVPAGFGVPLQAYADFVQHPPNSDIRALIEKLVSDVQGGQLSPKDLAKRSEEVQHAIMAGSFPPGALETIRAKLDEVLPGVEKIKVRSSANAEDIPNFDGAGLHDSFAADTDKRDRPIGACLIEEDDEEGGEVKRKVKPKSVGCAVKGVYASLWNKRAVEERFFARIDQTNIAMGLAIVPAYDPESEIAANAVVVTRVLNTYDVFGYSLSVQEGNNLVTNPDPGTHSEVTIAAFIGDDEPTSLTVTRFAKPTPDAPERTEPVLSTRADAGTGRGRQGGGGGVLPGQTGLLPRLPLRHLGRRQAGRAGPGGQDPGERAPGLQAGPRVRGALTRQTLATIEGVRPLRVPASRDDDRVGPRPRCGGWHVAAGARTDRQLCTSSCAAPRPLPRIGPGPPRSPAGCSARTGRWPGRTASWGLQQPGAPRRANP